MGLLVKALVVALLTLPVVAYVTGSLVGASSELPDHVDPVVVGDTMDVEPQPTFQPQPSRPPEADDPDDPDDDGPDDDDDDPDDDSVSVVRPEPRDIDDDADDRDDDGDDHDGDDHEDDGS